MGDSGVPENWHIWAGWVSRLIVTPVPHGLEDLVGKSSGVRTPGLHMSSIYNDLYQDLEPTRYVRGSEPDPLRLEAGLSFETFLEDALRARLCGGGRPDEMVTEEGILFNPDLIIFNHVTRVGEMKLTWLSSRAVPREPSNCLPPKFGKYECQMKAYCRCLETPYARLIAFFVNGPYDRKSELAPELLAWDITFTRRELEENWSMLMNHARAKKMLPC